MTHTLLVASLLLFVSPAYADLRVTTHVDVRRVEGSGPGKGPDIAALMQMLMPPGDAVTFVGTDAIRIEQSREGKTVIILLRSDGQTILDPDAQTYTRLPELGNVLNEAAAQPPPTFRRTGDFAMIHGVRTERVEVTMLVTLPVIPPPGFPTVLTMTGEIWLSDAFKTYSPGLQKALGLAGRLPTTGLEGMVLRQILRSAEFGYEVESTVTDLSDAPIAPAMFSIPEGYREISGIGLR
jgi:hypothetical protein